MDIYNDLHRRLQDKQQKLNDTTDQGKRQIIQWDIKIIKLRMDIERTQELKRNN